MDAYKVLRLIEDIAATGSRTEKTRLLEELVKSEIGTFVVKWTYDPFVTYGITAGPTESGDTLNIQFRPSLIQPLLEKLAKRELTGLRAEREVAEVMQSLDATGARLLYLILSKDLKCGIAEATISAVAPGLLPAFSVMRAHAYDVKKVKAWPVRIEWKLDGNRNTFISKNSMGGFFTRSGKRVPALDFMVPVVMRAARVAYNKTDSGALRCLLSQDEGHSFNFVLDGEAMMGLFEDTGALRRKSQDAEGAELHLYDIMSLADFDAVGAVGDEQFKRRALLSEFVRLAQNHLEGQEAEMIQIVPQYLAMDDADVQSWFEKAREKTLAAYLARGNVEREAELLKVTIDKATGRPKVLEGIVVKDPNARYEKRKCHAWMKIKAEETEDLPVVGAFPGESGTKYEFTLGGLVVDRKGVHVRVGGGFSDRERDEIWELFQQEMARTDGSFISYEKDATIIRGAGFFEKILIHRLVEVEYHEVTPDGSLRHPRYVRFRDDKDGEVENKEEAA